MRKSGVSADNSSGRNRPPYLKATLSIVLLILLPWGSFACSLQRSGVVRVAGSTTVLPLAQEAATRFMDVHGGTNILVQGGGSSVGISQLQEGIIDIANSSRNLNSDEDPGRFIDNRIALDVIAIVVNPRVQVSNLSRDEVKGIFTGTITRWSEVGGEDEAIVVVVRDQASGTRQMFDQIALEKEDAAASAIECNSNGIIRETVAATPNSIGYLSLGYVNATIKAVGYDGVTASEETAKDNTYPLSRYLHMLTSREPRQTAREYIDYVLSEEFQTQVVAQEYIPVIDY